MATPQSRDYLRNRKDIPLSGSSVKWSEINIKKLVIDPAMDNI